MHSLYLDTLTPEQRRDVMLEAYRRQAAVCFVCERPIDLDAGDDQAPELEHIDPLDAGGADLPANMAVIHTACGMARQSPDLRLARELHRLGGTDASESGERTYGQALGFTVLGAVVPGTAYLAAGRRRLGLVTLGVVALVVVTLVYVLLRNRDLTGLAAELVSRPTLIQVVGVGVLVAAAAWAVVIATGHRMLVPSDASGTQQALGAALALLMGLVIAVPAIVVARYAFATHDLIEEVFESAGPQSGPPIDRADPWKDIPRLNLLILGGDSAEDGGLTTNTMIVISIDTSTGDTVMFGLPRNLRNVPIRAENPLHAIYPTGYSCGEEPRSCLLSGLYSEAKIVHADLFADDPDPGLTTLRGSVSEITGLDINYHMLVDLAGFAQIVDALGGVDLDVGPRRVPIAELDAEGNPLPPDSSTRYIPPGQQHLDGEAALAFARERHADFTRENRLLRQRAVISAIVDRADPVTLLLSYLDVVSTASETIRTDVPVDLIPALVDLGNAVRAREIRGVPIAAGVSLTDPDFVAIRQLVQLSLTTGAS